MRLWVLNFAQAYARRIKRGPCRARGAGSPPHRLCLCAAGGRVEASWARKAFEIAAWRSLVEMGLRCLLTLQQMWSFAAPEQLPKLQIRHAKEACHGLKLIPLQRTAMPRISMAGAWPWIRSATMRAEPQAMVQPIWPWPVLSHRLSSLLRPMMGGPSGVMGRRQAQ